ncbi:cupredoxin domain-containing protein [Mycobacterium branderi]|uniref:Amidase n=1 Tax=Mycobacterium branderi TaxID=43348 RepID=A0A7I7VZJ3_9MYCO|nr:cupredoxin family copper-binding protein [Mycobacterium branderi]MCV7233266.1 cupredoxin family copper-binding protein [Mycobacterium branderi]ORA41333.1 amidase [Mycobacterium branderi]BBZ10380.1 hypothetical protein MBRA_05750 [Mycobacterium branderi]
MPRRHRRAGIALAGILLLAGCAHSRPDTHPSVTFGSGGTPGMSAMPSMPPTTETGPAAPVAGDAVAIDNFAFVPPTLTVAAGSTVTWTNRDEEPHTVAASDGSFRSPGMGSQATYTHTFSTAGTFDYICSIHPFMHGTVVVTQ